MLIPISVAFFKPHAENPMSYVLTLVAADPSQHAVTKEHAQQTTEALSEHDIIPTCAPVWLAPDKALDLGISDRPARPVIQRLREIYDPQSIDLFISPVDNRRKKLLVADMDATIIEGETLDELADEAGIKKQVASITARAMNGEMEFLEALQERVALLKGLGVEKLEHVKSRMKLLPGADTLVKVMRKHEATCVLVSGGFTFFTEHAAAMAGFHHHHGNTLEIQGQMLSGRILPPVIDKQAKADFLRHYSGAIRIKPEHTLSIGDGANDIPMLKNAGLGIGYRPKPAVAQEIDNLIIHGDLTAALYAQGYTAQHVKV